jgi:uncharacterized membrane protein YgcG
MFYKGGICLGTGRIFARVICAFILLIGLYLFYTGSEITGILMAVAALVLYPGRKRAGKHSKAKRNGHYYYGDFDHDHHREVDDHEHDDDHNEHNDNVQDSNDSPYDGGDSSGGDSGGGGGD